MLPVDPLSPPGARGRPQPERSDDMLKTFIATTAVAAALGFGAMAQEAADPMAPQPDAMGAEPAQEPAAPGAAPTTMPSAETAPVLTPIASGTVSADALIGANLQTPDGQNIAEVEDVLLTPEGAVESLVIQFGGFLGFGSNKVLLTMDEVEMLQDESGTIVLQTSLTPESLEGRPVYEEGN
jgi:hypothetical protein